MNSGHEKDKMDAESNAHRSLIQRLDKAFSSEGLSPFSSKMACQFIQKELSAEGGNKRMERVVAYLVHMINRNSPSKEDLSSYGLSMYQFGCPELFKGLEAHPFWDKYRFPWVKQLEDSFPIIKQEFIDAKAFSSTGVFQPYRSPVKSNDIESDDLGALATSKGAWNVAYLQLHGLDSCSNENIFPKTIEILRSIPRSYDHSFLSALAPVSHIAPHHGPTNKKLRCQLPLVVPNEGKSWLRVGDQVIVLEEGKCVIFDDSFEHEAASEAGDSPRVVLVFDTWHPGFSDAEVRFLKYLSNARMNALKKASSALAEGNGQDIEQVEGESTFLSVIEASRQAAGRVSVEEVWGVK